MNWYHFKDWKFEFRSREFLVNKKRLSWFFYQFKIHKSIVQLNYPYENSVHEEKFFFVFPKWANDNTVKYNASTMFFIDFILCHYIPQKLTTISIKVEWWSELSTSTIYPHESFFLPLINHFRRRMGSNSRQNSPFKLSPAVFFLRLTRVSSRYKARAEKMVFKERGRSTLGAKWIQHSVARSYFNLSVIHSNIKLKSAFRDLPQKPIFRVLLYANDWASDKKTRFCFLCAFCGFTWVSRTRVKGVKIWIFADAAMLLNWEEYHGYFLFQSFQRKKRNQIKLKIVIDSESRKYLQSQIVNWENYFVNDYLQTVGPRILNLHRGFQ